MVDFSKIPFTGLVDECMAQGIDVSEEDTAETLRAKLGSVGEEEPSPMELESLEGLAEDEEED